MSSSRRARTETGGGDAFAEWDAVSGLEKARKQSPCLEKTIKSLPKVLLFRLNDFSFPDSHELMSGKTSFHISFNFSEIAR
jgi:hypothetical protein